MTLIKNDNITPDSHEFLTPSTTFNPETHPDYERQLQLEARMIDSGLARQISKDSTYKAKGRESRTTPGTYLIKTAIDSVTKALDAYIAEAQGGKPGRRHSIVIYLTEHNVSTEMASFIALRTCIDTISRRVTLQNLAAKIGKAIEVEARLTAFAKQTPQLQNMHIYQRMMDVAERLNRPNPDLADDALFAKLVEDYCLVQTAAADLRTASARVVQSFNIKIPYKDIEALRNNPAAAKQFLDAHNINLQDQAKMQVWMRAAGNDVAKMNRLMRLSQGGTRMHIANELIINNLLSSPKTWAVNKVSNAIKSAMWPAEKFLGSYIGGASTKAERLIARQEAIQTYVAFPKVIKESWSMAIKPARFALVIASMALMRTT